MHHVVVCTRLVIALAISAPFIVSNESTSLPAPMLSIRLEYSGRDVNERPQLSGRGNGSFIVTSRRRVTEIETIHGSAWSAA